MRPSCHFPHGYALLIGTGASTYPKWSLPVTVQDMHALAAVLTDPDLCGYASDAEHLRLIHDASATKQAILDGLCWLTARAAADPDATAIVFYSGHGWLDVASSRYYLIPHDVEPFDLTGSALPAEEFTAALSQIAATRLLVFMDCCHAAGMATAKEPATLKLPTGFAATAAPKGMTDTLRRGAGRAVFSSSTGLQRSWVRPDGALSIFTHHLLEALKGAGNRPGDDAVYISNLMTHLSHAVATSARMLCHAEQTPFFDAATEDFAVALLRGGKGLPAGGWEATQAETAARMIAQTRGTRSATVSGDVRNSVIVVGDHNRVDH